MPTNRRIPTDADLLTTVWERVRILEDNSGGLYFHLLQRGVAMADDVLISGMEESEDALTDCRLLTDWLDNVDEDQRWYADEYAGLDSLTHVATYWPVGATRGAGARLEGLTIHDDAPLGYAARRYLGIEG